ncbi:MAG TPA: MFS transporter [Capillimicrobium sp.]|jgi:EmrB/QacA subfamily drug resistance transporter
MPSNASRRRGAQLALLAFGSLVVALDFTIVYVALPEIARDVGVGAHDLQWVLSAYAVAYGGLLLLGGRMSDVLGRRRMFVAGMALFGTGSLLGALSSDPGQLITARVVQGAGGAVLFPATLSLVATLFAEGPERNRAMTVWAGAGAVGLSLGALLGGVLTEVAGWEGVFVVNVPLVVGGAIAAIALLPTDAPTAPGQRLDLPGALTGTAGASLLVLAIAQAPERGWTSTTVLVAAAIAIASCAAFLAIESRTADPLMPLRLLRHRPLVSAMGVIFAFGMTLQAVPYFLTLYLQDVLGFSALEGGAAFLVPTLAITAGNALADRLVARIGVRRTLAAGMLVGAVGAALLATLIAAGATYAGALAGIALSGLGMGLVYPPMFLAAAAGTPPAEQGTASGMASTALQVGSGVGLAVLVAVASSGLDGLGGEALRAATADGLAAALYVVAGGALAGVAATIAVPSARAAEPVRASR